MDEYEIMYERMGQFITIAALGKDSDKVNSYMLNNLSVVYVLKFSNYVKSQIHLNLVTSMFDRDIHDYKYAYDHLRKTYSADERLLKVLAWFYGDMISFLANNVYDCHIRVIDDVGYFQTKYDIKQLKIRLRDFFNSISGADFNSAYAAIRDSEFAPVIDVLNSCDDLNNKPNSVLMIGVLYMLQKEVLDAIQGKA